ncbi:MAG: GtrA family protein, partial [Clostridia bacterium]|nr:GtrA family protein [Clostridia bacterium]
SRFGNAVTRTIFSLLTGNRIYDTQTGLRGFSKDMLDWLLTVPGERFEYEMNMLLGAKAAGYGFHEVEIDTVYLENNQSSHFRVIADSFRIYMPILKFSASSLLAGLLDFILLFVIKFFTGNLLAATVVARIVSSLCNFLVNKTYVFKKSNANGQSAIGKYYALAALILALNYMLLSLLNEQLGIPLVIAKLVTEGVLFLFSYTCQKKFVFRHQEAALVQSKSQNPLGMKKKHVAVSHNR